MRFYNGVLVAVFLIRLPTSPLRVVPSREKYAPVRCSNVTKNFLLFFFFFFFLRYQIYLIKYIYFIKSTLSNNYYIFE